MTTLPFTELEHAVYDIERRYTPWNVQMEVATTELIDRERLQEAARAACAAHPLARVRKRPADAWDTEYVWEVPERAADVPLEVVTDDDLASVRPSFYGEPFDLEAAPPFRLLVVRGAGESGGDRLLVCTSHIPIDGVGILRLVRSICRAYRGEAIEDDPVDLETSREVLDERRSSSVPRRLDLLGSAASDLGRTVDPPARIAPEGPTDDLAWGFVHRRVEDDLAGRLVDDRPEWASVNDVLLAALHLAIDDWNADHGEEPGMVSSMMPVNFRPQEWFYEVVGMYALFESVTTRPRHREDPTRTLERVAEQTRAIKENDLPAALLESLDLLPDVTPVGLRQRLPSLLQGPGDGLLDTAMLSNLGRVPDPAPSLTGAGADELWFSPPCWKPTPLGVGVVTVDGTLRFVFRFMHTTLDREAAESFADRYFDLLSAPLDGSAPGRGM